MEEPATDHFALLMATQDPEVRVAVIRLLHSMFVTNADQIICKFSYYLPFFLTLLEEHSSCSIGYYQLTSELAEQLSSTDFELDSASLGAILDFVCQCFDPSSQNAKVDAFVAHLFDPSRLLRALPRIFISHSSSDHLEVLFKIVVSTQSMTPFRLIRPHAQELRRMVAARPLELMPKVIRCLLSTVAKISKFAASLALAGVAVDGVLPMLLPYIAFLRVKKSAGHSFRVLHRALTDDAFRSRSTPATARSPRRRTPTRASSPRTSQRKGRSSPPQSRRIAAPSSGGPSRQQSASERPSRSPSRIPGRSRHRPPSPTQRPLSRPPPMSLH
jgi:hypothetical protein